MALHPLANRIVVEPLEAEEKSAGGIVLPDAAKEKPQQGKVLAVGPGTLLKNGKRAKPDVKKGDIVLFAKYGGTEVKLEGKELKILQEDDILAKVKK